jgi:hypothetical protein
MADPVRGRLVRALIGILTESRGAATAATHDHERADGDTIMKENVGTTDRTFRALAAPAIMAVGYTRLGGNEGSTEGLATMIAGALLLESAITRVCPVNALLGIDTS